MVAAFTMARGLNRPRVACASTGNTSASLAMVAAQTTTRDGQPMDGIVFVGGGKISLGKLSQALDYGARTIQIAGDFDACMQLVQDAAERLGLYLMNSVNPFRLEGQKTIMYRVLEGLNWEVPDWIIVPGGNLGNSSAFGKAFIELRQLGLIDRLPRLAIINASGASSLCDLYEDRGLRFNGGDIDQGMIDGYFSELRERGWAAKTIASAIEIGLPVNLVKALRSLEAMQGVVRRATDEEILNGKALVGRFGYGCEPASGASVAGLRLLLADGTISRGDRVVCILTGHGLKDPTATIDYHQGGSDADRRPFANPPVPCADDLEEVVKLVGG
jgi:threonine synthase